MAVIATVVGAVALAGPMAAAAPVLSGPTVVTVHANQPMAAVGDAAVGVNDWNPDEQLRTPSTNRRLAEAGVRIRELNSGPYDDVYRWRTNTEDANPVTDAIGKQTPQPWQDWVKQTKAIGAQAMIHVNYGSTATAGPGGTDIGPQEAAAWVRRANIVDHDNIRYWAIGEEVWGNGYLYQPPTEPDTHADRSPAAYGANVVRFAQAMKAVDPTIKIGVEIVPFGGGNGFPDWNGPLFKAAGSAIDFVDLHWYNYTRGPATDASLFAASRAVPGVLKLIRSQLAAGVPNPSHVQMVIGETNSNGLTPGVQSTSTPNALFAADDITTWLENGASDVNWFDTHIGAVADQPGAPDDPDGTGYGDWGLLSAGTCAENSKGAQVCEPPVNTPFPAYYGYLLASRMAQPGARFVQVSGAPGPIVTHAAVERNGDLVVLVENQDPDAAHDVRLDYPGYRPFPIALATGYGRGSTGLPQSLVGPGCVHLAPYSMTELVLKRG